MKQQRKETSSFDVSQYRDLAATVLDSSEFFTEVGQQIHAKRFGSTPNIILKSDHPSGQGVMFLSRDAMRSLGHLLLVMANMPIEQGNGPK